MDFDDRTAMPVIKINFRPSNYGGKLSVNLRIFNRGAG